MYNRYIPQPDGTYRRNRMQDAQRPTQPQMPQTSGSDTDQSCPEEQRPASNPAGMSRKPPQTRKRPASPPASAGSFLRQLLPVDFDTEDLLVVILLLLMAGDCQEDRNNALLTMALYLFL